MVCRPGGTAGRALEGWAAGSGLVLCSEALPREGLASFCLSHGRNSPGGGGVSREPDLARCIRRTFPIGNVRERADCLTEQGRRLLSLSGDGTWS